jgi:hypothetical protein
VTGQWVLRLVGDFEQPGAVHFLPCTSQQNALDRAAWWSGYRWDVTAAAVWWDNGTMLRARGPRAPKRAGVRS